MMSASRRGCDASDERGIVLAVFLVFLVVLTIAAFSGASLTRTSIQVVNNMQNEKEAFYIAEAGINEAVMRLALPNPTNQSVNGGTAFNVAITPNAGLYSWTGTIQATGTGPVTGPPYTTPTIQKTGKVLSYLPVSIKWDVCSAADAYGCSAANTIRTKAGGKVLVLSATGTSGAAQRTVTVRRTMGTATSAYILDATACPSLSVTGGSTATWLKALKVNSTAACANGINITGSGHLSAVGEIDVMGNYSLGGGATVSPTPTIHQPQVSDPLASLPAPNLGSLTIQNGSAAIPVTPWNPTGASLVTINPGIYYGGIFLDSVDLVFMNPGVYVMAGGGFRVGNGARVSGTGVTIFNTYDASHNSGFGLAGQVTITGSGIATLSAPITGIYAGVVIFQERSSVMATQPAVSFGNSAQANLDGLIYAPSANMSLSGAASALKTEFCVGTMTVAGSATNTPPTYSALDNNGGNSQQIGWEDF